MTDETLYQQIGELAAEVRHLCRRHDEVLARLDHHSARIAALERWRWLLTGGGLVVGAVVGYVLGG